VGAALDGVECNGSVVNSAASALRTVRSFDTIENNFDYGYDAAVAGGQSEFALPQLLVQAQERQSASVMGRNASQDNFDANRATACDVMTPGIHCCRDDDVGPRDYVRSKRIFVSTHELNAEAAAESIVRDCDGDMVRWAAKGPN
jgi:hypothetical protein